MKATPALAQASVSVALIGREALLMSVSARQNFWKPPPVPEIPTVTRTPGLAFWNSSATASLTGKTVLDPSRVTTDGAAVPVDDAGWPPPHPASANTPRAVSQDETHHSHVAIVASGRFRSSFRRVNSTLRECQRGGSGWTRTDDFLMNSSVRVRRYRRRPPVGSQRGSQGRILTKSLTWATTTT